MKKHLIRYIAGSATLAVPVLGFASSHNSPGLGTFETVVKDLGSIINSLIPIASGLALLAFFFGLAKYIFQADDEEAKEQGRRIMIGGIVALFLIAALGGIIEFLSNILGIDTSQNFDATNFQDSIPQGGGGSGGP